MSNASDKVMFEIYREAGYDRRYRVVYFTELNEHNKETEIRRALEGEHFFDSFLRESSVGEAKKKVAQILNRLNDGEPLTPPVVEAEISDYLAQ